MKNVKVIISLHVGEGFHNLGKHNTFMLLKQPPGYPRRVLKSIRQGEDEGRREHILRSVSNAWQTHTPEAIKW